MLDEDGFPPYIKVWADCESTGVLDYDIGYNLERDDLAITDDLWNRLQSWVKRYQPIIRKTTQERLEIREVINDLDLEGLQLARQLQTVLGNITKVYYFSEGRLKFLEMAV